MLTETEGKGSFIKLAAKRQSVRAYKYKPVENEKLLRCIEAARLAPSACNAQPWKFIVVDEPELKNKIADLTSNRLLPLNHFTKQAPVHVVLVMEKPNLTSGIGSSLRNKHFPLIDIGIAAEHFCLQATYEGLGTCMIGWFNEKEVKRLLGIPRNKRAMLIITVGYSSDDRIRDKKRKPISEIFSKNGYLSDED